jgi:hypothetical protein
MNKVRAVVAREFTRQYQDLSPARFTRSELLGMAAGDESGLCECLRELEERGIIRLLPDSGHPDYSTPIVEVVGPMPPDFLSSQPKA